VISPTHRPLPDKEQHSQETDFDNIGGIRTRNPSKQAAADPRHCGWRSKHFSFMYLGINRFTLFQTTSYMNGISVVSTLRVTVFTNDIITGCSKKFCDFIVMSNSLGLK